MSVPEEYGGLGLPILDTALILEEIAKVCYVTAMAVLGEAGVQTRVIARYAPAAIRERILPRVVSGDCILAICMTEPHAGTDVANYRTNARIVGDRVILKGTKTLISRAPEAGMFVVFTRIDGKPGREGIGCVLLEAGTQGSRSPAPTTRWAARTCTRSSSTIANCRWRTWSSARMASASCSPRSTRSAA